MDQLNALRQLFSCDCLLGECSQMLYKLQLGLVIVCFALSFTSLLCGKPKQILMDIKWLTPECVYYRD